MNITAVFVNMWNSKRRCSIMFVQKSLGAVGGGHVPPPPSSPWIRPWLQLIRFTITKFSISLYWPCRMGLAVQKWMKTEPLYKRQKDISGSVEFSDVQIVHKFAGRMTPNLDVKVTISSNVSKMVQDMNYTSVCELAEENCGVRSEAQKAAIRRRRRRWGEENGEGGGGVPFFSRLLGLGECRKLLQMGPGGAPVETGFRAFWALKNHVLTRKFSIFDIFSICGGFIWPPRQINKRI